MTYNELSINQSSTITNLPENFNFALSFGASLKSVRDFNANSLKVGCLTADGGRASFWGGSFCSSSSSALCTTTASVSVNYSYIGVQRGNFIWLGDRGKDQIIPG